MNKIGVVILNYLNFSDTIECIDTLVNQEKCDFKVIIVDNGSKNNSVEKIRNKIDLLSNFFILESKENLGYAKGNNLGITFLKEKFNINRVIICNNDVLFTDNRFIERLSNIEYSSNIGAIGTTIIGSDGLNQNPARWEYSFESVQKQVESYKNTRLELYKRVKKKIISTKFGAHLKIIKNRFFRKKLVSKYDSNHILDENELLHGSVIFLTENYLNKFGGFYPKTFLYGEEMILKIIFNKSGLDMLYVPKLKAKHKEDQSSAMSFNNDSEVMNRYQFESNKVILEMYNKNLKNIMSDFKI